MAGTLPIGLIFLNSSDFIQSLAILTSMISCGIFPILQRAQTALEGWDMQSIQSLIVILRKIFIIIRLQSVKQTHYKQFKDKLHKKNEYRNFTINGFLIINPKSNFSQIIQILCSPCLILNSLISIDCHFRFSLALLTNFIIEQTSLIQLINLLCILSQHLQNQMFGNSFLAVKSEYLSLPPDSQHTQYEDSPHYQHSNSNRSNVRIRENQLRQQSNWKYTKAGIFLFGFVLLTILMIQESQKSSKSRRISELEQKVLEFECLTQNSLNSFQTCQSLLNIPRDNKVLKPKKIKQTYIPKMKYRIQSSIKALNDAITSKFQFSKQMFMNWFNSNHTLDEVEFYRLDKQYDLHHSVPQKYFCILYPFYNLLNNGLEKSPIHLLLKSIDGQNYSNYKLYMIDDFSTDNSVDFLMNQLTKYPKANNRATIIKNNKRIGALANRDLTIRKFCKPGQIIIDIAGYDCLIGRQVLNLYNRLYNQNKEAWFIYTNSIKVEGSNQGGAGNFNFDMSTAKKGPSKNISEQFLMTSRYRLSLDEWSTSQLRSYLYDLYIKIPFSHLIDLKSRQYYWQASEKFTMYTMVELAGFKHILFFEEYPYFEYAPNYTSSSQNNCSVYQFFYNQAKSRTLTPLTHLTSLEDEPKLVKKYNTPLQIQKYQLSRRVELVECQNKNGVKS